MILNTFYTLAGELQGMPVIVESGLCTDDDSTKNQLRKDETEDVELIRVPRRSGLVAKALNGATLRTVTVSDPMIGRFPNCLQLGRTKFQFAFPRQPLAGTGFTGKGILAYQRQWVQLEE